jgi:hypothetical protein
MKRPLQQGNSLEIAANVNDIKTYLLLRKSWLAMVWKNATNSTAKAHNICWFCEFVSSSKFL